MKVRSISPTPPIINYRWAALTHPELTSRPTEYILRTDVALADTRARGRNGCECALSRSQSGRTLRSFTAAIKCAKCHTLIKCERSPLVGKFASQFQRPARVRIGAIIGITVSLAVLFIGAVGLWQYQKSRLTAIALADGTKAFDAGDWTSAAQNLGRYIARNPADMDAMLKYARAQRRINPLQAANLGQSAAAYRKILRARPSNELNREFATLLRVTGQYDELAHFAEPLAPKSLDSDQTPTSEDAAATLWLAEATLVQRRSGSAAEAQIDRLRRLCEALEKQPSRPEVASARALLARAYLQTDPNSQDAREMIASGLAYDANAPELLLLQAIVHRQPTSQSTSPPPATEASIKDLERATQHPRVTANLLLSIADELLVMNDLDRAETLLNELSTRPASAVWDDFVDFDQWRAALFSVSARLALQRHQQGRTEYLHKLQERTTALLRELKSRTARLAVLPAAVEIYARSEMAAEARTAFDELDGILKLVDPTPGQAERLALLGAIVARSEKDYDKIIALLEPLAERPGVPELARRMLLDAYLTKGDTRKAKPSVDQLAQRSDATPDVILLAATLAARQEQVGEQIALAERGLNARGGMDERTEVELRILRLDGWIKRATRETPDDKHVRMMLDEAEQLAATDARPKVAILHSSANELAKRLDQAELILLDAIRKSPDAFELQLQLARFLARAGRTDDARSAFARLRAGNPTKPAAWLESAAFLIVAGDIPAAEQVLDEALRSNTVSQPDAEQICLAAATLESRGGREDAARSRLQKACETYPKSIAVRVMLTSLPSVQRDEKTLNGLIDEIRTLECKGVRDGKEGTVWRILKAQRLLDTAEWAEHFDAGDNTTSIRKMLEYCLREDPGSAQAAILLGKALENFGKSGEAIATSQFEAEAVYRRSLEANPSTVVFDALSRLYMKQRRFDDAQRLLVELTPVLGKSGTSARSTAIAIASGEIGESLKELRKKVEATGTGASGPKDAASLLTLARLTYMERQSATDALRYLDEALAAGAAPLEVASIKVPILLADKRPDEAMAVADALVTQFGSDTDIRTFRGGLAASLKDYAKAEEDYRAIIAVDPSGSGEIYLGELFMQMSRPDDAIEAWTQGAKRAPENVNLWRGLSKALINRNGLNDLEVAESYAKKLEGRNPNDIDAVWIRAVIAFRATPRRDEELKALLERALTARGERSEAFGGLARIAVQIGDAQMAKKILSRGSSIVPDAFDLLAQLAAVALGGGDAATALDAAKQAIQRASNDPRNYIFVIEVLQRVKDDVALEQLRKHLAALLKERRSDDLCARMLAHTLHLQGRTGEAIETLNRFRQSDPSAGAVPVLLALEDYYRITKSDAKAADALRQAATLAPDDPAVVRSQLVRLYRDKQSKELTERAVEFASRGDAARLAIAGDLLRQMEGCLPAAAEAFRKLADLDKTSPEPLAKLADTLMAMKDFDGSTAAFRQAISRCPSDDPEILNNFAWMLARFRAEFAEAEKLATRAVAIRPDSPDMLDTLAYILTHGPQKGQAQREEAERLYGKCEKLVSPDSPARALTCLNLAQISFELGKVVRAKELATEASNLERARPTLEPEDRARLEKLMAQFPTP